MELRKIWLLIWQRKILVALLLVAALAAGYEATPTATLYSATATLFVGIPTASADQQIGQQDVAATFATMIPSFSVAQTAITSAAIPRSIPTLVGETRATVVFGTTLVHVTVTDPDPVVAQQAANAMASAFVAQVKQIYGAPGGSASPAGGATSNYSVAVSLTQPALVPTVPNSDGLSRNLALAGIFGLVAAIALVLLLNYLDLSVRTPDDLEARLDLPVIGVIPLYPRLSSDRNTLSGTRVRPARSALSDQPADFEEIPR